jgi:hypothetical protein
MEKAPSEAVAVQGPVVTFTAPEKSPTRPIRSKLPKVRSLQLTDRDLLIFQLLLIVDLIYDMRLESF